MKFVDEALIEVFAGNGGKGCISFRREKWVPRGGPDGGNGGKGGDVILKVHPEMSTLLDLKYKKTFKAERGRGGKGSNQEGKGGEDCIIYLPPGTLVYDPETNELLVELKKKGDVTIIAPGGRGGKGNSFFTSSTNQAPRMAQPGEEGVHKFLRLELKLLADVGLVGQPNAGKSTFLSVVSKARPKIADYPFTTLSPILGVAQYKDAFPFTIADIPGLIEGAHAGKGLGIQFLKHIERTKIFLHLISLGEDEPMSPLDRFMVINKELKSFDPSFSKRKQFVVLTKKDLCPSDKKLDEIVKEFKKKKLPVFVMSAVTREGVEELLKLLSKEVHATSSSNH